MPDEPPHQPLPAITGLPRLLWRRLGIAARVALLSAVIVAAVAIALLVPRIAEDKRDAAESERVAAAQAQERDARAARATQRPRSAAATVVERADGARAQRLAARSMIVADLRSAILADARARESERVRRIECERFPRSADRPPPESALGEPTVRLSCIAVTSDIAQAGDPSAGVIGYPYRARVRFRAGRFTWCRVIGRPGEGSVQSALAVLSPACGG